MLGRVDSQIKIRGHRLLAVEVEAILTTHQDIAAAGVCTMQSQHDKTILIAYVVLAHTQGLEVASLQAFVRSHLPDYMVPARTSCSRVIAADDGRQAGSTGAGPIGGPTLMDCDHRIHP